MKIRDIRKHASSGASQIRVNMDNEDLDSTIMNISRVLRKSNQFYGALSSLVQPKTESDQKIETITVFNKQKWDTFLEDLRSTYELLEIHFITITTEKVCKSYHSCNIIGLLTMCQGT